MPYYEFVWDRRPGRNVDHIAAHGVTPEEAAHVVVNPYWSGPNRRHPDRFFAKGFTPEGRKLGVSYVLLRGGKVYVITAFEVE